MGVESDPARAVMRVEGCFVPDAVRSARLRLSKLNALRDMTPLDLPADVDVESERHRAAMLKWAMDLQDGSVPLTPLRCWTSSTTAIKLGDQILTAQPDEYVLFCERVWDADTGDVKSWAVRVRREAL